MLENALKDACAMPATTAQRLATHLDKEAGDTMPLHDGAEREIPRPANEEKQQAHYSGKKKSIH